MTKPRSRKKPEAAPADAPAPEAAPPAAAKKPAAKKAKKKRAPRSPDKKILAEKRKAEGKSKTGRPPEITVTIQEEVCKAIRNGSYMETAAAYAGISKDTLYAWMRKGARREGPEYIAFSDAIKKALAESEVLGIAQIRKHGQESWQAVAWYLERRFKERWGRSIKIDNDLKDKTNEELLALLEDANTPGA